GGFGAEAAAIEAVQTEQRRCTCCEASPPSSGAVHDPGIDISGPETSPWRCAGLLQDIGRCSARQAMSPRWRWCWGRMTSALPSYRSVFGDAPSDILRVFPDQPERPDGTVSILHGNSSVIALTIRDRPGVQALCAFCGQLGRTTNYLDQRRASASTTSRLSGDSQSESELQVRREILSSAAQALAAAAAAPVCQARKVRQGEPNSCHL
uniref:ACT domain-containing protein n=1 Tax=Macrostomum lignano TaxID=282301 RepID=A0A1I8FQ91_9PLAT